MPPSWVCCLLPLASVLLLGQPTQGFSFRSSPGPAPGKTKASEGMWAKQKNMLLKQALQAHAQVLLHMNEKHNETFFMAPGETTHIMVQSVFGQVYHVETILVKADCPENYTDNLMAITGKDCKSKPDSPKMKCNFEVTELYGLDVYIVSGEDCHDYIPPPTSPDNTDKSVDPTQEDKGSPYI